MKKLTSRFLILAVGVVTVSCTTHSRNPRWRSLSLRNESDFDAEVVYSIGNQMRSHLWVSAGAFKTEGFAPYDTGAPAQVTFTLEDKNNTKVSASFDTAKYYPDAPPNTDEITTAYVLTKDKKIELRFIIDPTEGQSKTITIKSEPNNRKDDTGE